MAQEDNWYQELTLEFSDGTREVMFLDITRSGRHKPRQRGVPAEWTKLAFHQCPCCALSQQLYCPAALSLEETILTLRRRISTEVVIATAEDAEGRRTSVKWPLQDVGAMFVQLSVFSSGCPVGNRFRPLVRDLRPFSTSRELGKHLVYKHLPQHKGDVAAAVHAVIEQFAPLHEVFSHLFERLDAVPTDMLQDAIPNSIVHMHAMTCYVGAMVQELVEEILRETR